MTNWLLWVGCWLKGGHYYARRAVDPTLKQTTRSVIVCVGCGKPYRKDHLADVVDKPPYPE